LPAFIDLGDGEYQAYCRFNESKAFLGPPPGLSIGGIAPRGLRIAYEIAQHFGARVLWEFECPPERV
jgi:hypothetical protein